MNKVTYVVEYKHGEQPQLNIGMDALGGRVISASAYNFRDRQLTHAEAGAILDSLKYGSLSDSCDRYFTNYDSLIEKLKLLA